ncbi:MAG: flap endonuclease [Deltaproteobacteria bacterium]|nr:flap endonuclease [Deltaproteobacteria bacterium]MBI3389633.1 flap endonuclease [Deltaproteobacteria bacterium]
MSTLHLLDATFELFRAYFAMPSETAPDGREVGAIRGLIGSTLALLREPDVTQIGAATDHVIESFRNQLFAGYKRGDGIPPDLWAQFPFAEDALRALGVVVWPMIEFEADDALATAAARFADAVEQVVILSPDKDLMQCVVGQHVVTYDRVRQKRYDDSAVRAKFGVEPSSIPDLLALVGDSADGIPGIQGWGMKSTAAVLSVYRTIDAIPLDAREWRVPLRRAARLAATLAEHRDDARLYKTLATLRTDAPISPTLAEMEWKGVRRDLFLPLCQRCGFGDLASRPTRWDEESAR